MFYLLEKKTAQERAKAEYVADHKRIEFHKLFT